MAWLSGYSYRKKLTIDSSYIDPTDTKETLVPGNASADSNYGSNYLPGNAVDGKIGTFWASNSAPPPHWLSYDFGVGNEKTIGKVAIIPWGDSCGYGVKDFIIQGSNNGTDWDNLYSDQHPNDDSRVEYEFSNSTAYRYYRLYCTTTWRTSYSKQAVAEFELYNADSDLKDLPVLVRLDDTNFTFAHAKSDGTDIRFTSADKTTTLSFEREFHGEYLSNNLGIYFVKIPSVSSSVDTEFYIYYGNDSASDGQDPASVWDDYTAVWHMKEELDGTADELVDSTGNGHDGQGRGSIPSRYSSLIGYGQRGLGSGYYITAPDHDDLDLTGDFEISWKMKWINSVSRGSIFGKSQGGGSQPKWIIYYFSTYMRFHSGVFTLSWTWYPAADTWYNCRLRRSGNDWSFYVDGEQVGSTLTRAISVPNTTQDFHFFADGESWRWFNGVLDEVRLRNGSVETDVWDKAIYYSDTDQLLTFGTEEEEQVPEQLTPSLQWRSIGSVQLTPSLQWSAQKQSQSELSLQWQAKYAHRFCPNLINYEFDFLTPTVYTSKNTATVSGVLHSITINMKDTGSSGSTIIELYVDGTLRATKTISADGSEYETVEYFDMTTLIYPLDTFEVRVTQVATGAEDLKICVYEMTFPFDLDRTFFGNIKDSTQFVGINRDYLFKNADYWTVDFNQPIYDVTHITVTDVNGDDVAVTYVVTDGNFYRSRIRLVPYTTASVDKIAVKIQDQNKKNYSFNFYPAIEDNFADYPSYVSETTAEIEVFLPATYFRYSFDDGATWSDWGTISSSNTMTMDFTEASGGANDIKVQFRNGSDELEETVSIYYVSGTIDCNVVFYGEVAKIIYADGVPLDRVELYYDDELADTFNLPVKTGMDFISVDEGAKTITVNAGSLYWNNERYDWDATPYNVNPDFAGNNYNTYWKYVFGFNTITNEFEFKEEIDTEPFSNVDDNLYENFIRIWTQKVVAFSLNADWSSWSLNVATTAFDVFEESTVPVTIDLDKVIKIKILDVAGRNKEFEFDFIQTKYNIWRTVSVTRNNVEHSGYSDSDIGGYAFDGTSSFWTSPTGGSLPQWIRYECGYGSDKKTVVEYAITNRWADSDALPTDWKFQGSIDGDNWVDLDTVSGETWTAQETKEYAIANTVAYVFYRLYVTGSSGGVYVQITELELRESIGGANVASYTTETEVLPGQIHSSSELNIDIKSEDWELDSMNGG